MRRVLVLLALASHSRAEQLSLTLAAVRKLAVQNSPQLSASRLTAVAARQVPLEYRANRYPTVAGAVTAVGADNGSRLAAGGLNNPAVFDRFASGLTMNQLVTDFGRTTSLIGSAKLRADAQDQIAETTRASVEIAATRAYFEVLRSRTLLTVALQTVEARKLVTEKVEALARNNIKSGLDASFARVNLSEAQLLVSQARNAVQSAEADLAAAIGLPSQVDFQLADEPMAPALADGVDVFIAKAIQDRPELKSLRLEQVALEKQSKADHSLNYPTVAIIGSAGVVPTGVAAVASRYGAIGLNMSIPVFNGGLYRIRQVESDLKARAAAQLATELSNRITRDVRVAYLNAKSAYERIALTEELLKQSEMALDLARGRYDLGLSSIIEVSQAQLNLTSARIAGASANYEYLNRLAILDYQAGR